MDMSLVLPSVAIIWSIAVVTPGPNFFITIKTAISSSQRTALAVVLGICTGTATWAISAYLGVNLLFQTAPFLYISLKLLGASYIIYLGIMNLLAKPLQQSDPDVSSATPSCWKKNFNTGLLINLTNPKTAAFMTSIFATAIPANASFLFGMVITIMITAISAIWYSFVAFVFSRHQSRIQYRKLKSCIDKLAGIIFIGFGLKLAAEN